MKPETIEERMLHYTKRILSLELDNVALHKCLIESGAISAERLLEIRKAVEQDKNEAFASLNRPTSKLD